MRKVDWLAALLSATCAANVSAQVAIPPLPSVPGSTTRVEPLPGAVKAVVVRSWDPANTDALVWNHLSANWSSYGSIPVYVDYTSLIGAPSFTLVDLQNTGADVVIVSDPAGDLQQWTSSEVAALASYANMGHPLVGSFLFLNSGTDDRALFSLWGLRSDLAYQVAPLPPTSPAAFTAPQSCLFARMPDPFDPGGWPYVEVPADQSWDEQDLAGASFVARSADGRFVVTTYSNGPLHATYISTMPEYQDGSAFDATQYLYNAITCQYGVTPTTRSTWGRVKGMYK